MSTPSAIPPNETGPHELRSIGIVGFGAVGSLLTSELAANGVEVVVWTRSPLEPTRLPQGARAVDRLEQAVAATQGIVLAVADDALEQLDERLAPWRPKVVLHTCGAKAPSVLRSLGEGGAARGLLHPLHSIPGGGSSSLRGAPVALRGAPSALALGEALAGALGARAFRLADSDRAQVRYHAAASLISGGTAAALAHALELAEDSFVDPQQAREGLASLAQSVARNLHQQAPREAMTGPIPRGSAALVEAHLAALEPSERELYAEIASSILRVVRGRLEPSARERIERAIATAGEAAGESPDGGAGLPPDAPGTA